MALPTIVSIRETVGSRKAVLEWSQGAERSSQDRVFLIVTESVVTDLNELISLAGNSSYGDTIPEMGEEYPSDPFSTVHGLQPLEIDGYLTYNMMVRYRNPDPGGQNSDPTENDWVLSSDNAPIQKIVETDTSTNDDGDQIGEDVLNSAGDPFLDPLKETYAYTVINASKWFNSWSLDTQSIRQGATNRTTLTAFGKVFPPRTLRCTQWKTTGKQDVNGGEYYQLQAQFVYRPVRRVQSEDGTIVEDGKNYIEVAGWDRAVIDQGFREQGDEPNRCVPIMTRGGTTQTPFKLNGAGGRAPCGKTWFLVFQTTFDQEMNDWDLPDTWV